MRVSEVRQVGRGATRSLEFAFFDFGLHLFSLHAIAVVPCGAYEFALQVVDVALAVEQVLLLVTLDLNSAQAFLGQIFRIVHINHIIFFLR